MLSSLRSLACIAALATLAAAGQGCSTLNTTAVQCLSEAECLAKAATDPSFVGTTCDPVSKTCVAVPTDQDLCTSNQACITKNGVPSICRSSDKTCIVLQTPECPTLVDPKNQLIDDRTIVIGALTPAGHTALGDVMEGAMELAQAEFSTQNGGLPSVDGTPADVRPLVILSCREFSAAADSVLAGAGGSGYTGLLTAAQHLANDVQVPLVIGPIDPTNAILVTEQVFVPASILTILPAGISSSEVQAAVTGPTAPTPIVWQPNLTDVNIASAYEQLITKNLIPALQKTVTGPIRIATLVENQVVTEESANLMEADLMFNGMTAAQNAMASPPNYLRATFVDVNDTADFPSPDESISAAVTAVAAFKPHIIIHSYGPGVIPRALMAMAFEWPGVAGPTVPQAYQLDLIGVFGAFQPLFPVIDSTGLQGKVFSVTPVTQTMSVNNAWAEGFISLYPQFKVGAFAPDPFFLNVQAWYDSTYLAAYAITANGSKPLTGANVAATLPLLIPPGQVVPVGPDNKQKAVGLLTSGSGIALDGLSGNLNLNPKTGVPDYDIVITCPQVGMNAACANPTAPCTYNFTASGVYTANHLATGSLSCPGH